MYSIIPGTLGCKREDDRVIEIANTVSEKETNVYMTGSLRTYMSIILGTIFIVTFIVMYLTNGFALDTSDLAPITTLEIVVVGSIIVAAGATVFSNNNVA